MHREPSEEEKRIIKKQHTRNDKVRCFVNDHPIDNESDIDFHHIKPFSHHGPTEVSNLAPVCRDHHKRIRTLSITEFRTRLELEEFFINLSPRKLDDVLEEKIGINKYGKILKTEISNAGNEIKIFFDEGINPTELPLYMCPSTGFKYFYAMIPITYIKNDSELQPRPLETKKLWELYRHFLIHTQLSPAICRLENDNILLFDGQHKTTAQIWIGRKSIECKVYIEPDIMILKETNLTAHDKLRQMPFFTSVLINKWADLFQEEWDEYKESLGDKSESGFVTFLIEKGKTKTDAINMIKSSIYNSILDDETNLITEYLAERNRTRKNPLTVHTLKQTFLKHFIASPPLSIVIEELDELREFERKNLVRILNILTEETLLHKWSPEANNNLHRVSERIYTAGSIKAWSNMLKDIVAQVLSLYDDQERKRILLREVSESDWELIKGRMRRLFEHKLWTDPSPEIDNNLRVNNETHVRNYFQQKDLTVNWVLGGSGE